MLKINKNWKELYLYEKISSVLLLVSCVFVMVLAGLQISGKVNRSFEIELIVAFILMMQAAINWRKDKRIAALSICTMACIVIIVITK